MAKATIKKKPAKFDPSKKYEWDPKASFTFTGQDFMHMYNTIKEEIFVAGGTAIANKITVNTILQNTFEKYVESGVIRPIAQ